jgi:ubiquinone/menaquinone biosynthesis C-methylase UbiE
LGVTNFDERAKDWDSDPKKVERAQVVAEAIRNTVSLSLKMNALEYGCGTGLLSFALNEDLGKITLADTSQGMLDVLKEKIATSGATNMHPLRLDLTVDSPPDEKYHLTYSLLTLHHIHDTQMILKKFHDILLLNGILLIADLDKEDGSFHTDGTTDIHKGFTRRELYIQVEDAGFTDIGFTTAYTIKKKIGEEEKSFPIFLMSAKKKK